LYEIEVTYKSNHILHRFSTAARLVEAHLELCKSRGQTVIKVTKALRVKID